MPANKTRTVRSAKKENRCHKVKTSLRAGGEIPKNDTIKPKPVNTVNN